MCYYYVEASSIQCKRSRIKSLTLALMGGEMCSQLLLTLLGDRRFSIAAASILEIIDLVVPYAIGQIQTYLSKQPVDGVLFLGDLGGIQALTIYPKISCLYQAGTGGFFRQW